MSDRASGPSGAQVWSQWGPQLPTGVLIALYGLTYLWPPTSSDDGTALVVLCVGAAVALSRRAPGGALGLAWLCGVVQVVAGSPVVTVQFALALVAYGCARWGSVATVWISGLSIPLGAAAAAVYVGTDAFTILGDFVRPSSRLIEERFPAPAVAYLVIAGGLLAAPWLAGLAVRATSRAQRSEVGQAEAQQQAAAAQRETEQAQEIARLRDEQARLARDVHDVVGHSLAVILAQAESGQYLPDDDPARLKQTLATIATSARGSLQDVRVVLAGPGDAAGGPDGAAGGGAEDRFRQLLDGVRASGHEVVASEVGTPRPLPPDLEVVAHRVAQEMLTNAIKHGRRDAPILVERHWPEGAWDRDLRIEVRNAATTGTSGPAGSAEVRMDETQPMRPVTGPPGQGLDGMRRRLDSVGGRLDVRRRAEPEGPTFTATAWVPVSGVGRT